MNPSICASCGKPRTRRSDGRGWNGCHGWCSGCSERWRLAGRPVEGPPPSQRAQRISAGLRRWHATHTQSRAARAALAAGRLLGREVASPDPVVFAAGRELSHRPAGEASARRKANRVQDYLWLTSFGESRWEAARRVGVSVWTALAYELADAKKAAREGEAA